MKKQVTILLLLLLSISLVVSILLAQAQTQLEPDFIPPPINDFLDADSSGDEEEMWGMFLEKQSFSTGAQAPPILEDHFLTLDFTDVTATTAFVSTEPPGVVTIKQSSAVAARPDYKQVAVGEDNKIKLYGFTGEEMMVITEKELKDVQSLAFTKNGKFLLALASNTVCMYGFSENGSLVKVHQKELSESAIDICSTEKGVAVLYKNKVSVWGWDGDDWQETASITGLSDGRDIDFDPERKAIGIVDGSTLKYFLWDGANYLLTGSFILPEGTKDMVFSCGGVRSVSKDETVYHAFTGVKSSDLAQIDTTGKMYDASANPGEAYLAFDSNERTSWDAHSKTPQWVQIDLGNKKCVVQMAVVVPTMFGEPFIKDFLLQGSNDGIAWTDIFNGTMTADMGPQGTFTINNSRSYRFYRLHVLSTRVTPCVVVREIRLWEKSTSFSEYAPFGSSEGGERIAASPWGVYDFILVSNEGVNYYGFTGDSFCVVPQLSVLNQKQELSGVWDNGEGGSSPLISQEYYSKVIDLDKPMESIVIEAEMEVPQGTSVSFAASLDGGATWTDVLLNQPTKLPQGDKLVYKMTLQAESYDSVPVVDRVTIYDGDDFELVTDGIIPAPAERGRKILIKIKAVNSYTHEPVQLDSMVATIPISNMPNSKQPHKAEMEFDEVEGDYRYEHLIPGEIAEAGLWPDDGDYQVRVTGRKVSVEKSITLDLTIKGHILKRVFIKTKQW